MSQQHAADWQLVLVLHQVPAVALRNNPALELR